MDTSKTKIISKELQSNYNSWWKQKNITGYLDIVNKFYNDILNTLLKYNNKSKEKKLLDVACGTGEFLKDARAYGMKLYGIDLSDYAIKFAKKQLKDAELIVGSGEKLPYKDNQFDYVVCIGSLEHFPDPEKGASEMARVLKKDGICLIHVPNLMFLGHIYMTFKYGVMPSEGKQQFSERFYTYKGWKELLERNNLRVLDCTVVNDMRASKKVSPLTKFIWQYSLRPFVPFHLSYAFNFYCKKK